MMSWKIELLMRQSRGAIKNKIFPRNEISIVPSELVILKVLRMISLEFLQALPFPSFHDTWYHSFGA